jgi:hypothetical protein
VHALPSPWILHAESSCRFLDKGREDKEEMEEQEKKKLVGSECARCPRLQEETKGATILGIFHFLLFCIGTVVQNPRRGCHRFPKF